MNWITPFVNTSRIVLVVVLAIVMLANFISIVMPFTLRKNFVGIFLKIQ